MCKTSEQIDQLATALAKAQGAMRAADKDGTNPHFGKAYTTLAAVWDVIRQPLAENGLSVIQPVQFGEQGGILITTRLMHTSGQYAESSLLMPLEKNTAQGAGSAITYGRRYGLSAMVGVVSDEDDDGNDAAANAPKKQQGKKPEPKAEEPACLTPKEELRLAEVKDDLARCAASADLRELMNTASKGQRKFFVDTIVPLFTERKGELLTKEGAQAA